MVERARNSRECEQSTARRDWSEEKKNEKRLGERPFLSRRPPSARSLQFRLFRSAISRALSTIQKGAASSIGGYESLKKEIYKNDEHWSKGLHPKKKQPVNTLSAELDHEQSLFPLRESRTKRTREWVPCVSRFHAAGNFHAPSRVLFPRLSLSGDRDCL